MATPTTYSLVGYGHLITDHPRMDAYAQALRQAVRPGCVVLDIGAGTGIFSLLACQLGASHVHAVEPGDAIQVAHAMAMANGYADRITFHQALSTAITLPQTANVIVSDLRSVLPLFQHHDRLAVISRGRIVAQGTPSSLKANDGQFVRLQVNLTPGAVLPAPPPFARRPLRLGHRWHFEIDLLHAAEAMRLAQDRLADGVAEDNALGATTTRFILEAQRDLQDAQSRLLKAKIDLIKSRIALDKALGDTLQAHNIRVEEALRPFK